jgi:hypothetical protein
MALDEHSSRRLGGLAFRRLLLGGRLALRDRYAVEEDISSPESLGGELGGELGHLESMRQIQTS